MYLVTELQVLLITKKISNKPNYIVYGLKDHNNRLMYIGSTNQQLIQRIKQHKQDAKKGKTALHKWIQSMNYEPVVEIITYTESNMQMLMVERHLINTTEHLVNIKKIG